MKRLMFLALIGAAFTLGSGTVVAERKHAANSTFCLQNPAACEDSSVNYGNVATATSPIQMNGNLYKQNGNVTPFVPGDLAFADPRIMGFNCDENGMRSQPRPNSGCADYVSKKDNSRWRLRKVQQGTVESIFRLPKDGSVQLHVRFAGNGDVHRVVKISPEAEKMVQANGYQYNGTTAVAIGSVTPAPLSIDCNSSSLNINDRLTCVKRGGNGAGGTSTASTTPAPAQGPDCSVLSGLMKMKCEAAASLAKAQGALPDVPTAVIVKP